MSALLPLDFRKILVCQLRQIGDVLLATPSVELLRRRYPDAEIHFFTEKKCAPMLANNPHLARVWQVDKKELTSLRREIAFYRRVASEGYDLVVDFQQLPRIRWVVGFSHAKVRLSYTAPWYTRWLYTHTAPMLPGYAAMCKASVLAPLGIEWNGERPRLYLSKLERAWAGHFFQQHGLTDEHLVVTLDPTHRRETRRWPAKHWARLVDIASEARPELRFVVLVGPGEEDVARDLAGRVRRPENLVVPNRILSLRELAAVIDAAALHAGNCSAPSHMAVAVDTPSLIVRGSTSDAWRFPSPEHVSIKAGLECQPCNENVCPKGTNECLTGLTPERVAPELLALLPHLPPET
ncbi:glycosyl transferase family 9 [Desulfovibrio sp. X2]|uniref:glycosyltransferase family 9 protein n=1 Tax=Desulfovibrio sp. X2 TaxID=941449 RepID=UPI000358DFF4|nr:glycosyltransferase family 9 protein [Desulfovibrio sp. X2]EPR44104.1 glycosyl transferase family 9 [Desulfovibrio sp. X2]